MSYLQVRDTTLCLICLKLSRKNLRPTAIQLHHSLRICMSNLISKVLNKIFVGHWLRYLSNDFQHTSWSRKEYYYHHKSFGKCTPKWIRYSAKNKNRIRCVHPDCEAKKDVNFTYAGIMKHIIELHTSQESAVSIYV